MTYEYVVQANRVVEDICILTLVPQRTAKQLQFIPGQYVTLQLIRHGRPTPARCFSITSSPTSGVLQFGMRIEGAFTSTAATLQPGEIVRLQGPFGQFTLDPVADKAAVFIAGGIGITPFISMLRASTEQGSTVPITLLYSNRSASNIPFYNELLELAAQNPYLNVQFYCGTVPPDAPSNMHAGRIGEQPLNTLCATAAPGTTYFICGPKAMTQSVQTILKARGVPSQRIVTESFSQTSSIRFAIGARSLKASSLTYALSAGALVLSVGGILTLDLLHTVPKLSAQSTSTTTTQTTTPSQTQYTEDSPVGEDDDTYTYSPPQSSPTTTTPTAQATPQSTYQAPMSHVS